MPVQKLTPQNFEFFSGNDVEIFVPVVDQDDKVVDITGASIEWRLTKTNKNKTGLITKTTSGGGIVITNGLGGIFKIIIAKAEAEGLLGGEYYHEARITIAGRNSTVLYGFPTIRDNTVNS